MTDSPWFGLRGEYGEDPFTYDLSDEVRGKLALLAGDFVAGVLRDTLQDMELSSFVYSELKRAFGLARIRGSGEFGENYQNFISAGDAKQSLRSFEVVLNCCLRAYATSRQTWNLKVDVNSEDAVAKMVVQTNRLFRMHMCGYQVTVSPEAPLLRVVRTDSFYMHEATVREPLRLLSSANLPTAEQQFFDAVREWSEGNYADAITDANSALETAMKFVLETDSGTAGQLIKRLLKEGYLPAYLQSSVEKLHELFEMLPRLRDEKGDAHGRLSSEELSNHARLAINLSGSFIVFLLEEWNRRKASA